MPHDLGRRYDTHYSTTFYGGEFTRALDLHGRRCENGEMSSRPGESMLCPPPSLLVSFCSAAAIFPPATLGQRRRIAVFLETLQENRRCRHLIQRSPRFPLRQTKGMRE